MTPLTTGQDCFLRLARRSHPSLRRFFYTVLIEEPLDLPGIDGNTRCARDRSSQIFETCLGMLDKLYQDQNRDLCGKLSWQAPAGHGPALDIGYGRIDGEIDVGPRQFLTLEPVLAG